MKEFKHTPGPWRYEAGRDGRPPYVIRGTEGGFSVVGMTANRQENDASLIAAAPELLEALSGLVGCIDHGSDNPEQKLNAARAAIAKALGESK